MRTNKILFKEGDEVAHKENLNTQLEVRKIIRAKKRGRKEGEPDRTFTLGIECGWWVGNEYRVQVFHTNVLVPWSIASDGYTSVVRYLNDMQNING